MVNYYFHCGLYDMSDEHEFGVFCDAVAESIGEQIEFIAVEDGDQRSDNQWLSEPERARIIRLRRIH